MQNSIEDVIASFRKEKNTKEELESLKEQHNQVRVCPNLLPTNKSKFILAQVKNDVQLKYEREDITPGLQMRCASKTLSKGQEEIRRKQRERKRKSRNKLVSKNGITKSKQHWVNEQKRLDYLLQKQRKRPDFPCKTILPVNALTEFAQRSDISGAYVIIKETVVTVKDVIRHVPVTSATDKTLNASSTASSKWDITGECVSRNNNGGVKISTVNRVLGDVLKKLQ